MPIVHLRDDPFQSPAHISWWDFAFWALVACSQVTWSPLERIGFVFSTTGAYFWTCSIISIISAVVFSFFRTPSGTCGNMYMGIFSIYAKYMVMLLSAICTTQAQTTKHFRFCCHLQWILMGNALRHHILQPLELRQLANYNQGCHTAKFLPQFCAISIFMASKW